MSSPDTTTERPASSPGAVTVVTESPAASYRHRSVNVRLSVSVWLVTSASSWAVRTVRYCSCTALPVSPPPQPHSSRHSSSGHMIFFTVIPPFREGSPLLHLFQRIGQFL